MPRQCQFPVQLSDNRRCYRSSGTPGFILSVVVVAVLAGYAGIIHASADLRAGASAMDAAKSG